MPLRLAIDLGAGSGRALVGGLAAGGWTLREVHRFRYEPRQSAGHLRWDMRRLIEGLQTGLARASAEARERGDALRSVGVDSWAVDYGLIDRRGVLLEEPICYRDERAGRAMPDVFARVPREELFARTGIQVLALNTLFQLTAHVRDGLPAGADRLLLIPDLCHHLLCGSRDTELTNASTTQLLRSDRTGWDDELFERIGLPRAIMPAVADAGTRLGTLATEWQQACGADPLDVLAPATHDTASAVAGTPLGPGWAYISSGTWSLVGVETSEPLATPEAARANVTNEAGVFGTTRLLKNVMGLWILESCRREWGGAIPYDELVARAAQAPEPPGLIYPDDQRFFNPPSMDAAVRASLAGQHAGRDLDAIGLTRVILDSLALRYASVVRALERLTGRHIPGIHIVGGGSLNRYLNQAAADASGRPVLAGPAEATAIGSIVVQAIASGEVASLAEARRQLSACLPLERYDPRDPAGWQRLAERYEAIEGAAGGM